MAGYHKFSMSNNAVDAYENGLKTASKWIAELKKQGASFANVTAEIIIKNARYTEQHHTSKYFNLTKFYNWDDIQTALPKIEKACIKLAQTSDEKVKITYPIWGGSIKNPKFLGEESKEGILKGNWVFFEDGTKKKASANGVTVEKI